MQATMDHYIYTTRLKQIWCDAVAKYQAGNRNPETYFNPSTLAELASLGLNIMDVYDYAEDFVSHDDPSFETFLLVCEVRRDYFLNIQKGQPSKQTLDPSTLPAKDQSLAGILWLPRILPKALAKIRGELPPEVMYGCGGDRRFFKANNIHPAEFLRIVESQHQDVSNIISWLKSRSESSPT